LVILHLIREINKKTAHLQLGEIVVYSDMKKIINDVHMEIEKESQCVREASATTIAIRKEIEKASISIRLEYSNTKIRQDRTFSQNPGPYLIKECDEKSKVLRKNLQEEKVESIKKIVKTTPIHNGRILDKSVNTFI